jgi:hypothetical protein
MDMMRQASPRDVIVAASLVVIRHDAAAWPLAGIYRIVRLEQGPNVAICSIILSFLVGIDLYATRIVRLEVRLKPGFSCRTRYLRANTNFNILIATDIRACSIVELSQDAHKGATS